MGVDAVESCVGVWTTELSGSIWTLGTHQALRGHVNTPVSTLKAAPALPHSPGPLSPTHLPVLVFSEVGHLVLLGHRAPFSLSTHLSLSKVLGHSCLEHGHAKSGGACSSLCPLHPFLQSPVA